MLFGLSIDFGWVGHLLAAFYLAWLLNLYNFMDGINGIASLEAITVASGGAVLYLVSDPTSPRWLTPLVLAATTLGFLYWNFPKARIFMGDVGSGFLGITLGVLSIQAAQVDSNLFWAWLILLGAFVVDATVTLMRRVLRGETFYEAHRTHAYQYAARLYGAHAPVSVVFAVINLVFLLPIASLVAAGLLDGFLGLLLAYIPLVGVAYRYKAGARALQEV